VIAKSCKYDFRPLEKGKVIAPILRFRSGPLSGFTLIEVLVAITLIVTIVSMVYGSYFATAKSADVYETRMNMSAQTRKVLNWMTRQIRCSYIFKAEDEKNSIGTDSKLTNIISRSPVVYFNYKSNAYDSVILHFVTTQKLFSEDGQANGLFDVAYKFDRNIGTLYLSQRRFTGTSEKYLEDRNWRPILTNVESVELDFFNGQKWCSEWDFEQMKKLPFAVKIAITCKDENNRRCRYGTVADIHCSGNYKLGAISKKLVNK
jgi:prepilin-type N-terminal cleavage/methylation domain-containing protein